MHEASIAQGILDTALAALPAGKKLLITRITIVAGALSGVSKDSLELYFDEISKETAAQGAELELIHQTAELLCTQCGHAVEYDSGQEVVPACSRCGGPNRLRAESSVYIDHLEVEGED